MTGMLFTVNDRDIAFLKEQWDVLLALYTADQSIKDDSFELLKGKYSEKSRFYHNLSHIQTLLHLYESLRHKMKDDHAIRFSIWFHDVVYDTTRDDNEENSARFASKTLRTLHAEAEMMKHVQELVLATKSHNGRDLSEDARLFLDLDLAILGAEKETYERYSQAIRQEYAWVAELTYRTSRRKILQRFMNRESIYSTQEMRRSFEGQARRNMADEIQLLDTQSIL